MHGFQRYLNGVRNSWTINLEEPDGLIEKGDNTMAEVDGSIILAKALKQEGVEKVFTLPGGHTIRALQELGKLGIDVIDCRHEGPAAYAAEGYALASGKPGVVLLTAAVGVSYVMTEVVDAYLGNVPVLFIGGASAIMQDLTETLQGMDTFTMMKNQTVWASKCVETHRIAEHMAVAFRHMMGPSPGPVYVELPIDILQLIKVDEAIVKYPSHYRTDARIFGDPAYVEKAAELLIAAERPAMLIGDGSQYNCRNSEVFKELAEYLQMPTGASITNSGRFFNNDDPLFRVGNIAAAQADVLLLLSHKPGMAEIGGFNPQAKLINVNSNHRHVGLNLPLEVGIVGNADAVAEQILAAVKAKTAKRERTPWVKELTVNFEAIARKGQEIFFNNDATPLHPARLAGALQKFLNSPEGLNYNHVLSGADALMWAVEALTFYGTINHLGRFFTASYAGSMGAPWGLLNGLYQATGNPILHSVGDGSYGFNVGELYTFAKYKIPYVCVISNDGNYGMVKAFSMYATPGEDHEVCAIRPEGDKWFKYEAIAASWGGYGKCVSEPKDLLPALFEASKAAAGGVPAIINCLVDCKEEYFSSGTLSLYKLLCNPPNIY